MRATTRHFIPSTILVSALLLVVFPVRAIDSLPTELSDREFWQLSSSLSEPDGFFHSDNFVSNERSFQTVLKDLEAGRQPGSAYVGVGPEQNFTYLLAVKPKIAFIVDVRRQNLVAHLMYKALFELSHDRADFVSRLLSRPRPSGLTEKATVDELFDAFGNVQLDLQFLQDTRALVKKHLIEFNGFPLDPEDQASLDRILLAFSTGGGNLTYDGPVFGQGARTVTGIMPTFEELMRSTDGEGNHRSFLATEENFRTIQGLQRKNLLIPVVGDFAGSRALRGVGQYLRDHNATVTAFYTSNVEQYLFLDQISNRFYNNVATLPVDERSVIVRGVIRSVNGEYSSSPALPPTSRYETRLFPIPTLVSAFKSGEIQFYEDVLKAR